MTKQGTRFIFNNINNFLTHAGRKTPAYFQSKMAKRIERLRTSLENKKENFSNKISNHAKTVRAANGQPLNDKGKKGAATLRKWEKQNDGIRTAIKEVEKTEAAIVREEARLERKEERQELVAKTNETMPAEILQLVEQGILNQWQKYPNRFFVVGVEKARIIWDAKKRKVLHQNYREIADAEQCKKFGEIYNSLDAILNK